MFKCLNLQQMHLLIKHMLVLKYNSDVNNLYMKNIIILIFMIFFITSCRAHMVYPPMTKDGVNDYQIRKDAFECKTMAADFRSKHTGSGSPSFGIPGVAQHRKQENAAIEAANEYYIECMELRGYKIIHKKENKD